MKNTTPQGTAVAPQGTAVAPQGTAVAPQGTAVAPQNMSETKTQGAPSYFNLSIGESLMINGTEYKIAELISSGTEAEIYKVSAQGKDYAVKLYKKGFLPNTKIFRQLQEMKGKNIIVDIYDSGSLIINNIGAKYELMQYIAHGAVSRRDLRGKANDIAEIAISAAVALDEFHRHGLIHKDIKPANLLLYKEGKNDVVLCDFGISDVVGPNGICATIQSRTPIYAAPEVYTDTYMIGSDTYCEITEKADYYSLGMTILSLWYGEAMFRSKEAELASQKRHGHLQIPHDMPEKLAKIVRGLTVINPKNRWDLQAIQDYISGKDVAIDEGTGAARQATQQSFNFVFDSQNGKVATTLDELVQFMQEDNDLAVKYLYKGIVSRNLQTAYPDLSLRIDDIVEHKYPYDKYSGLYSVLFMLKPDLPIGLTGYRRDNGQEESVPCLEIKDIVDFCCTHYYLLDGDIEFLLSDAFIDWVEVKEPSVSLELRKLKESVEDSVRRDGLKKEHEDVAYYYMMLQKLDGSVDFAMNRNGGKKVKPEVEIAQYLSLAMCAFGQIFDEDMDKMREEWGSVNFKHKTELSPEFIGSIFDAAADYNKSWLKFYMDSKGIPQQWDMVFATDSDNLQLRKIPYSNVDMIMEAAMNLLGNMMPPYYVLGKDMQLSGLEDLKKMKQPVLHAELNKGLRHWILLAFPETLVSDWEIIEKGEQKYIAFLESLDVTDCCVQQYYAAIKANEQQMWDEIKACRFWNNLTRCGHSVIGNKPHIGYKININESGVELLGRGGDDNTGLGNKDLFYPMGDFVYREGKLYLKHHTESLSIDLKRSSFILEEKEFIENEQKVSMPDAIGCNLVIAIPGALFFGIFVFTWFHRVVLGAGGDIPPTWTRLLGFGFLGMLIWTLICLLKHNLRQ